MALRRWKPFLGAFAHFDATIEAAVGVSRDSFRRQRARLVEEALCAAAAHDGDRAVGEEACALLDAAMAEALLTLRDAVRESAAKGALASEEVVAALGALVRRHASPRAWKQGVEAEAAAAVAAKKVLDAVCASARPVPSAATKRDVIEIGPEKKKKKKMAAGPTGGRCDAKATSKVFVSDRKNSAPKNADPVFGCVRVKVSAYTEVSTSAGIPAPQPKETLPTKIGGPGDKRTTTMTVQPSIAEETTKMTATKRKLHERYQEEEDAKRRRRIQVIQAPPPLPQKTMTQVQPRTTTQPAMRAPSRSRASCAGERSSSLWRRV